MAIVGWSHLILILSIIILSLLILFLLFMAVPILIVDYIIKHAGRKAVKEALEEKVSPLQVTTRICPQCERGVTEEAKFCPNCGKQL